MGTVPWVPESEGRHDGPPSVRRPGMCRDEKGKMSLDEMNRFLLQTKSVLITATPCAQKTGKCTIGYFSNSLDILILSCVCLLMGAAGQGRQV